jgi:hypothetical protein
LTSGAAAAAGAAEGAGAAAFFAKAGHGSMQAHAPTSPARRKKRLVIPCRKKEF